MKSLTIPLVLILLVTAATVCGLFLRGDGQLVEGMTARGQTAVYADSGVYRYNPVSFVREGRIWDTVNLFVAVPLLILSCFLTVRGDLRGKVLRAGMSAYLLYVYLSCVMMYAFSNLFLVYVGIVALSGVELARSVRTVEPFQPAHERGRRFPHALFVTFSLVFAVALVVLWSARIGTIMRTGLMPEGFIGLHTLGSQALDLGLLVPLSIATGIELIRRTRLGYQLCAIAMTIGLMMFICIPCWIVVPLAQEGQVRLLEAIPFFLLSVAGIALALAFYRRLPAAHAEDSREEPNELY
jgi:hypothetical protein